MNRRELISEIDIQISEFKNILTSEKDHDILEEKVLNLLCEIDGKITEIVGNKDSIQKEIIFHRFIAMHLIDTNFTSIDDFLDDYLAIAYKEIEERITVLSHDLFIPGNLDIEKSDTDNKNKITVKKTDKNKILKRVLHDLWYKPSDIIKIFVENLDTNRMRKIPYNIYYLDKSGMKKSVLICDQIWQATFVYEEIIDTDIFQNIEKWETIWDSQALKIIYSKKSFGSNLEIALSDTLNFDEKEKKIVNEDEEKADLLVKKGKYTLLELQELNIPEKVLWTYNKWNVYSKEMNKLNPKKRLPISLVWLAKICWCKKSKKELMEKLWIVSREYTILELQTLHIPEEVLWDDKEWRSYAEEMNKLNLEKQLPLTLSWLATKCGCKKQKWKLMEKLWIVSKEYTLLELQELNIPEEVLSYEKTWKSYAQEVNRKYPKKYIRVSLEWLSKICWCNKIKKELMKKLGIKNKKT